MQLHDSDTSRSGRRARVVVAMSGGVDSSVAAALLVAQGYDVIGMMLRLWSEPDLGKGAGTNRCCTPSQMADARRVADRLEFPLYVLDAQELFHRTIVQSYVKEHKKGRTPNPCINCNKNIRFSYLMEHARALGAEFLATGHYARVTQSPAGLELRRAIDIAKDQSYVLHVLDQEQLAHVKFPIGNYTKDEVRQLATEYALPVAEKSESMDLCFLGDGDYRRFLREHAPDVGQPGSVINLEGQEIGQHEGLPFYTIGQRKGLGIAVGEPIYVIEKDVKKNTLTVGSKRHLARNSLVAQDVNWIAGEPPSKPLDVEVKIRYKARPIPAVVAAQLSGRAVVTFREPVYGVTSGQGAVFYIEDLCIGGGIIVDEVRT